MNYYVYALKEENSDIPFYIGKGKGRRMYVHEQRARLGKASNKNWKLFRKIKLILSQHQSIIYEKLYENISSEEALKLESEIIKKYGLNILCNLNFGGTGRPEGYKHSEETKRKIADGNTGKKFSLERRKNIGLTKIGNSYMKGKHLSNEAKKKISIANTGNSCGRPIERSGFISPNEEIFSPVFNLTQFCKDKKLTYCLMHALITGKQHHHKGWKLWQKRPNQENKKVEDYNKKFEI